MNFELVIPTGEKRSKDVDVAIIGGGPAGLSAGIYAVRSGLNAIVIEKGNAGGLAEEAPYVENYLGFTGIDGEALAMKFKEHAMKYVEISERNEVRNVKRVGEEFQIESEKGVYMARAVIFATGTTHKKLNIPGEDKFYGRGVSYCVTCDGYFFKGKRVAVIGGGNSGAVAAIYLKDIGAEPVIYEFMPRYMCEKSYQDMIEDRGIRYNKNVQVMRIEGRDRVEKIVYKKRESNEVLEEQLSGVFIYVGLIPLSDLAKNMGVEIDQRGYIKVDMSMRTNVAGVYAAGDITGRAGQMIIAAGQGAQAALSAYEDLMLK